MQEAERVKAKIYRAPAISFRSLHSFVVWTGCLDSLSFRVSSAEETQATQKTPGTTLEPELDPSLLDMRGAKVMEAF